MPPVFGEMKIAKRIKRRLEEKKRALYVRLPHAIQDKKDVAKLFTGDFNVNLLRQRKKYCYVIFANEEEKLRNLEAARDARVNGKRVIVAPAITKIQKKTTVVRKKIVIPKVKQDVKVTRNLFVSNIKCGTKRDELKAAIPGCLTVQLLKAYTKTSRAAIVKMESLQAAAEYLTKKKESPTVRGRKLKINPDTRDRHRRTNSKPLKIYDGEPDTQKNDNKNKDESLDYIALQSNM